MLSVTFTRYLLSVVYRPKNPYKHRPLPYLIGSKEWHEKWHIGLIEEDSDQSENENNEDEEEDGEDEEIQSMSSSPAISVSSNVPVSLSEYENPTGVIPSKRSSQYSYINNSKRILRSFEIPFIREFFPVFLQMLKIYFKAHPKKMYPNYPMKLQIVI